MNKRSEYTVLVSFALLAVGLGFWGYALAGSAYSPSPQGSDAEAVRLAVRALAEPSLSLWLISKEEPPEFFARKARGGAGERNAFIQRANGWARRERVVVDA